jgi:nicotinamidase-related amidase/alkylated DNA repair dioxygenase AlkB
VPAPEILTVADSTTRTALVVVDMQNDFLSEGGAFPRRHVEAATLTSAVALLVATAREQGRTIVWVRSAYGEVAGIAGETHVGAPCCVRGSWGAEPVTGLADRVERGDVEIIKGWYSAFRGTELHARLTAAGVTTVVLCGVATNVCVLATAREARRLGYAVEVVPEATAAANTNKQAGGLREIEACGGVRRGWGELLGEAPATITGLGAGGTTLWCGALGEVIDAGTYAALAAEVDWQAMLHRGGEVPRRVAIQGAMEDGCEPLYRHPVDTQPRMVPFTPIVDAIRGAVERRIGQRLNHCLLQLYRDGRDWIGEHADKTLDVVQGSKIINVSLGRTRTMILRPKKSAETDTRAIQRIPLPHGSFLAMDLATNRAMFHAIRQEVLDRGDSPRISLTFRDIGTFVDRRSGAVWGVGAPCADRASAEALISEKYELAVEDRWQEARREGLRMLKLFREENQDPGFDVAAYRPGFWIAELGKVEERS